MKTKNDLRNIVTGILLLFGLHIVVFIFLSVLAYFIRGLNTTIAAYIIFALFYIGLLQLFYVVPTTAWLKRKQQRGKAKGVIIGAGMTALINLGCFILWVFSFR